jgi:hypothetical protein
MNLQTLVVVLLRLVSLNFLLQVFYQMAPQLMRFSEFYKRVHDEEARSLIVLPVVLVIGLAIGAVLVWIFAMPIARLVTRGLPPELSFGALALADCYSIVFIGIGLYYMFSHFPAALNWAHYLFKAATATTTNAWQEGVRWYDVSQTFIPLILGIILFVNGRKWAVALARRQTLGTPPVSPPNPVPENL